MPGYYFGSSDARILKQIVGNYQNSPGNLTVGDLTSNNPVTQSYLLVLDAGVGPASWDPVGQRIVCPYTTGSIWRREAGNAENLSQDPENAITNRFSPQRDDSGKCVRRRVFNLLLRSFSACDVVQVLEDQFGDLFIVESERAVLNTLATTTTTPYPFTTTTAIPQPCNGTCRWDWNSYQNIWVLSSDGCGTTTTTTTSTTTTTTPDPSQPTTTTPDPCTCTNTSVTTISPPTTTTSVPCSCLYPLFCGTKTGDCAYTSCAPGRQYSTNLYCTTTTTTINPTTTCNCNTTTTLAPQCRGGCRWFSPPTGGGWLKVEDNCHNGCPCPAPDTAPSGNCVYTTTGCVPIVIPTTPIPPSYCVGSCTFYWDTATSRWVLAHWLCFWSGVTTCGCYAPSAPGSACGPVVIPCVSNDPTTLPPGPCWNCYTTTSTTTTTGNPGCNGSCTWRWNTSTGYWGIQSSTCSEACSCLYPAIAGHDNCEVTRTNCVDRTTTTTTSTTTTTQGPCGTCVWTWNASNTSWQLTTNCSSPTCYCPNDICMPCTPSNGQTVSTSCVRTGSAFSGCSDSTTTCAPGSGCGGSCTTTTTINPCQGCMYSAAPGSSSWTQVWTQCNGPCAACIAPSHVCSNPRCEGICCVTVPCGTTTTTTTTTTTAAPCGTCNYQWNGVSWNLILNGCSGGCHCNVPPTPGAFPGDARTTDCSL